MTGRILYLRYYRNLPSRQWTNKQLTRECELLLGDQLPIVNGVSDRVHVRVYRQCFTVLAQVAKAVIDRTHIVVHFDYQEVCGQIR